MYRVCAPFRHLVQFEITRFFVEAQDDTITISKTLYGIFDTCSRCTRRIHTSAISNTVFVHKINENKRHVENINYK